MKNVEKIRLGKVILEFSASGSLTDDNIVDFLGGISAIDTLIVKGSVADMVENLRYINEKIAQCHVFVGHINSEVLV